MATVVNGALTYAGFVELGIRHAAATLNRLESARVAKRAVVCPMRAQWVRPAIFCTVRAILVNRLHFAFHPGKRTRCYPDPIFRFDQHVRLAVEWFEHLRR
jgi:hypothetical protein